MNKNEIKLYAKVVEEFDNIKTQTPEKGGALCVATENDECAVIKHGSSSEIVEALITAAVNDERIYQILSTAVGMARMHKLWQKNTKLANLLQ